MAWARLTCAALLGTLLLLDARPTQGQETGSDVHMPPPRIVVSSVALGLQTAGAAPTAQAFAARVQQTVAQTRGDPRGESRARTQLGDFRASILIKAGVLSFGGSARAPRTAEAAVRGKRPAWATRPIVFVSEAIRAGAAHR
ncbi:MAG: hypothetical protein BMS9Abin29_2251 [Gemmatimonadota bacterium]|nr:MAG: hypothetical protein BMS9Abin29_2251 [Gemmatimonadota bacterium]